MNCLWSAEMHSRFRPSVNDISAHYTHPFPSQDGNRRSFITSTEPRRIPQNGVAPFRMESQTEIEVNWSGMSNEAIISFVGELYYFIRSFLRQKKTKKNIG